MTWRFGCIVALLLMVFSSKTNAQTLPAGFARNPYGVAGSPGALKSLSMPATSSFYDWTPKEKARYITVRPYSPPRGGIAADDSTNPFFWNLSSGMIGRSEADRTKFREFVLRNKGAIWIVGNEPERSSQDNLTPTEYAKMFHTYHTSVKQLDSSAKLAIASVGQVTYYVEFGAVRPYYDSVFAEYKRLYGVPLPLDYWNLHTYYAGWEPQHESEPVAMVTKTFDTIINPYITYAQSVDAGRYRDKKIIATEIGLGLPNDNALGLSEAKALEFVRLYTQRFVAGVDAGTFVGFFWFYGGWKNQCAHSFECLIASDWKTPTATGALYAQLARNWDRQFGLEQADFNQDKKIGILDFSGLVKVFGTNNALLSLDSDPKITRADLTIFKQVFNLANQ